ncbi:hypothetical protein GCM10011529_22580 [Polymorphobacter glacialis]|uniref:DUF4136 domain-containing protein n=1 Tax=Sandarakinorhabdus glacialis TaxID=1614636 RepID=A0A917EA59_9SPHN|nr:DUF4136 domain-containing protein [Polymorphobacter glacialis]GGE15688.1 hypothetical protein GCM10011529_22580 [Polymorphobacter glacialis]
MIAVPLAMALLGLAACSNNNYADVVRFHNSAPISRGTLAVVASDPLVQQSLEFRTHAETVAIEMRRIGYTTGLPASQTQYVATIDISQADAMGNVTRPGVTVGAGIGLPIGSNSGLGANVSVPVGRGSRRNPNMRSTTLAVQIRRNADQAIIWEGRAVKEARVGEPGATATGAVPQLANALFREFPGTPGVTTQVRLN